MARKEMTKEERKQWAKAKFVKALRSGRYRKIEERCSGLDLEGKLCYCAVGVFGKVMRVPGAPSTEFDRLSYDLLYEVLKIDTKEIYSRNDGWQEHGGEPWSFKKIADWVEENV